MGLYESMELEVIRAEQGLRVANNHIAADLACVLGGRTWDGIWSHCEMMFSQMVNGLAVRVRNGTLSQRRYKRALRKWMADPAILRREVDW